MKPHLRIILVGSIALAVLALDAYVGRSQSPPTEQQHPERHGDASATDQAQGEGIALPSDGERHPDSEEYQAKKDAEERAALKAYESTADATWWLVYVTFVLVLGGIAVGGGQIWLMRRQAEIAASVANLERAWVILGPAKLRHIADRWEVLTSLRNCGRTPAFDVVCFYEWTGEMPEAIGQPRDASDATSPFVLGPGVTPPEWEQQVPASGVRAFYSGRITYRDQSKSVRSTTFCLSFEPFDGAIGQYVGPLNRAE